MMSSRTLIPLALVAVLAGCSLSDIGPHRIDVQQGNAIDAESLERLKPGLSRTQVRFLMGTPLVVDPFRNDRWDYVYEMRRAGKLTEQKRITLIFDGETLARIEGDAIERDGTESAASAAVAEAATSTATSEAAPVSESVSAFEATPATEAGTTEAAPVENAALPEAAQVDSYPPADAAPVEDYPAPTDEQSSIVAPFDPPAPTESAPPQDLPAAGLTPEVVIETITPDPEPSFSEPEATAESSEPALAPAEAEVLAAVNDWIAAWSSRNQDAYIAAYSAAFVPQGGGSRPAWEKRRRLLLGLAQSIDLKIEAPRVELARDGSATVTFNQFYRSDTYRDAVAKQVRLIREDGRWLIAEERVLNILKPQARR